jgi:hypothetical protein
MLVLALSLSLQKANSQQKFPENLEHFDSSKALIYTDQLRGGYQQVTSKVSRDAIPEDKRSLGMVVTWVETGRYVSKRFEGVNVLEANWIDDNNWRLLYVEGEGLDNLDSIIFNPIDISTFSNGRLQYENFTQALTFTNDIEGFTHQLGYEFVIRVYNNTADTIFDGTVVRGTGSFQNGSIIPTIAKAGNGSLDSLSGVAMATVDIPPNKHGIVTLLGPVNNLDFSSFSDGVEIFVGSNGLITDIPPIPPKWSRRLGQIIYADADSGQIFINPGAPNLTPSPHISGDTSEYNQILALATQDVYVKIPISAMALVEQIGYTRIGDSIRVDVAGFITIAFNSSYIGNNQSDVWRIAVFKNNEAINSVSRSTTSVAVGNSTVIATGECAVGDYISFRMKNESSDRDPTISDMSFEIIFLGQR